MPTAVCGETGSIIIDFEDIEGNELPRSRGGSRTQTEPYLVRLEVSGYFSGFMIYLLLVDMAAQRGLELRSRVC